MIPHFVVKKAFPPSESKSLEVSVRPVAEGFSLPREALLRPLNIELRLQEYRSEEKRNLLFLRGIALKKIHSGDLIIPSDWDGVESRRAYFYSPEKNYQSGNTLLQFGPFGPESPIEGNYQCKDHLVEVRWYRKIYLIPGESYELQGLGKMTLVHPGHLDKGQLSFTQKALSDWKKNQDLYRQTAALRLALFKWISLPFEKQDISLKGSILRGHYLVSTSYWEKQKTAFLKATAAMGGGSEKELKELFTRLYQPLLEECGGEEMVFRKGGFVLRADRDPRKNLSPFSSALLAKLEENPTGFSVTKLKPQERDQFEKMDRMGLVRFSEDVLCPEFWYQEQKERILSLLKEQDGQDLSQIKEALDISRRPLIRLLQWMEEEGEILNKDNCRYLS